MLTDIIRNYSCGGGVFLYTNQNYTFCIREDLRLDGIVLFQIQLNKGL